jgi:hypothetical protein
MRALDLRAREFTSRWRGFGGSAPNSKLLGCATGASFFGFALAVCFQKSSSKKVLAACSEPRKRI